MVIKSNIIIVSDDCRVFSYELSSFQMHQPLCHGLIDLLAGKHNTTNKNKSNKNTNNINNTNNTDNHIYYN